MICINFACEMGKDSFRFRQFEIRQDRCAMKVGTDGTLLGAWARGPQGVGRILDIGTGTGLIALMMAQRFPEATVTGLDIDGDAVRQAWENVLASPFARRINILESDVNTFHPSKPYDAIVSNPPYFVDSLTCPDQQRTTARHAVMLSYGVLMRRSFELLSREGSLSVVIPSESRPAIESEACLAGFFLSRVCMVRTTPRKVPKRQLVEFVKYPVKEIDIADRIIEQEPGERSPWYKELTREFYIK